MADKKKALIPDTMLVQQQPDSLERLLIVGMAKSYYLYKSLRERLCPFDKIKGSYRPDFTNNYYNKLFPVVDQWWRIFEHRPVANDMGMQPYHIETLLYDRVQKGILLGDDAVAIKTLVLSEMPDMDFTLEFITALPISECFNNWLERRVTAHEIASLGHKLQFGQATAQDLIDAAQRTNAARAQVANDIVPGGSLMFSSTVFRRAIPLGLENLDRVLGGGVFAGDTTMFGMINGGGKTVMAKQITQYMAMHHQNTVHITTEEPPPEVICRMASEYTNTPIDEFRERKDIPIDVPDFQMIPMLPPMLTQTTMELYNATVRLHEHLTKYVYFVDWSKGQGYSIESRLESTLDVLIRGGWIPKVLVVDWVGGGLEKLSNAPGRDSLRLVLKGAVDHIVNYAKQKQIAAITFAQIDKTKLRGEEKKCRMDMLSESKTMTDNITNFIGVSALRNGDDKEGAPRLRTRQYFYADKARKGQGGLVPMDQHFKFQRWSVPPKTLTGGSAGESEGY